MPTIAELQVNIDTRPVKQGVQDLNDFANAADRASKAAKTNSQTNTESAGSASKAAKSESDLTNMIDAQTRKLEQLAVQRKKLDQTGMKSTAPAEYERLNRIIDANIALVMRQGNAVDVLNAKQDRDITKREKTAQAELRAQERIVEAAIRQENVVSRASAKQQRDIEATINGLDRQVKAQNEYNRTMETLNRARVIGSNGGMGSDGGMSSGEYDTWVKLAQARRDAALATEDNSRAILQAQNKLDTYTATLGKVERAEVQYARAVRVLDENLAHGKITMDQYTAQVDRFAEKRDKSVAAANDNSKAEQRFARELQGVMSAYDPVIRAQDQYNASVSVLDAGLKSGVISVDQYNRALKQQQEALDNVKNSQSGMANLGAEYDSALNSLVPYRAELRNLEQQEKVLRAQKDAGMVTTEAQIRDYDKASAAIARNRSEINKRIQSGNAAGLSYKQEMAALRGMPAQITDIVVSLQGGQAPLTVLLQQGGQIKDMFGGIVPAIKGMGTALLAMVNPATVSAAIIATLGAAAYVGSQEITSFNRALIQAGSESGITAGQFTTFRDQLNDTTTTAGKAAEALTLIAKSGRIANDMFKGVAESAILMEKATGTAMSETIADFTALGKDPVDAAVRLDEKYRFLTASVLSQADALVKQGKESEAVKLLQGELQEATTSTATEMIAQAGYIERAWSGVKGIISETWDVMKGIGRESDANSASLRAQQLLMERTVARLKEGNAFSSGMSDSDIANNPAVKYIQSQINKYQELVDISTKDAEVKAKAEMARREAVAAEASSQKRSESSLKGVEKAELELLKVRRENAKIKAGTDTITPEQNERMLKNEARALKELADEKEKANKPGRAGALDTRDIKEVKNNLSVITAEYEGYYKRVTALGAANVVSDEATYRSQLAILESQRKAVSDSFDSQIASINKLKDNKKNSNAQNISLDNQLSKAQADQLVALEKIDAKKDSLAAKERGRIDEMERNVASYKAALDAQVQALEDEGARNADGVGRGGRQANVARQQAENDRSFAKQQAALSKSLGEGMDPDEYARKLRDLGAAHTKMTEQIIDNDRDIQAANADWTNGFTAAIENAQDAGMNFAGSMESALTGAFNSAGDALANFVTTGKFNFKDFTISVISDMAKIAAKQAAMGALSSLFSIAGSVASSYFGGASGGGGTTTGTSGFSEFGQVTTVQEKGGAWSGGTQLFAQGGAFTNSVVSSPTAFGMANGAMGIMGEAGEEAILPLTRTRNGDLGVRMTGGGSDTQSSGVLVNVYVSGEGTSSESSEEGYKGFGKEIGDFVDARYRTLMEKDLKAGGTLNRAIKET